VTPDFVFLARVGWNGKFASRISSRAELFDLLRYIIAAAESYS
jgi:hypothetical protein